MTVEEKKQVNRERQEAVRKAWKDEVLYVQNGFGTRNWTKEQQEELLTTGKVSGYEGHHMKSVSQYPAWADCDENIQFLTNKEHLEAHKCGYIQGGYSNYTNGFYEVDAKRINSFGDNEPIPPRLIELTENYDTTKALWGNEVEEVVEQYGGAFESELVDEEGLQQ